MSSPVSLAPALAEADADVSPVLSSPVLSAEALPLPDAESTADESNAPLPVTEPLVSPDVLPDADALAALPDITSALSSPPLPDVLPDALVSALEADSSPLSPLPMLLSPLLESPDIAAEPVSPVSSSPLPESPDTITEPVSSLSSASPLPEFPDMLTGPESSSTPLPSSTSPLLIPDRPMSGSLPDSSVVDPPLPSSRSFSSLPSTSMAPTPRRNTWRKQDSTENLNSDGEPNSLWIKTRTQMVLYYYRV